MTGTHVMVLFTNENCAVCNPLEFPTLKPLTCTDLVPNTTVTDQQGTVSTIAPIASFHRYSKSMLFVYYAFLRFTTEF